MTYDVTRALKKGRNAIGVVLGNGWFRGLWIKTIGTEIYWPWGLILIGLTVTLSTAFALRRLLPTAGVPDQAAPAGVPPNAHFQPGQSVA